MKIVMVLWIAILILLLLAISPLIVQAIAIFPVLWEVGNALVGMGG